MAKVRVCDRLGCTPAHSRRPARMINAAVRLQAVDDLRRRLQLESGQGRKNAVRPELQKVFRQSDRVMSGCFPNPPIDRRQRATEDIRAIGRKRDPISRQRLLLDHHMQMVRGPRGKQETLFDHPPPRALASQGTDDAKSVTSWTDGSFPSWRPRRIDRSASKPLGVSETKEIWANPVGKPCCLRSSKLGSKRRLRIVFPSNRNPVIWLSLRASRTKTRDVGTERWS